MLKKVIGKHVARRKMAAKKTGSRKVSAQKTSQTHSASKPNSGKNPVVIKALITVMVVAIIGVFCLIHYSQKTVPKTVTNQKDGGTPSLSINSGEVRVPIVTAAEYVPSFANGQMLLLELPLGQVHLEANVPVHVPYPAGARAFRWKPQAGMCLHCSLGNGAWCKLLPSGNKVKDFDYQSGSDDVNLGGDLGEGVTLSSDTPQNVTLYTYR